MTLHISLDCEFESRVGNIYVPILGKFHNLMTSLVQTVSDAFYQNGTGSSYPGAKLPERETDHSSQSNVGFKQEGEWLFAAL
jgi:hypothetical protein